MIQVLLLRRQQDRLLFQKSLIWNPPSKKNCNVCARRNYKSLLAGAARLRSVLFSRRIYALAPGPQPSELRHRLTAWLPGNLSSYNPAMSELLVILLRNPVIAEVGRTDFTLITALVTYLTQRFWGWNMKYKVASWKFRSHPAFLLEFWGVLKIPKLLRSLRWNLNGKHEERSKKIYSNESSKSFWCKSITQSKLEQMEKP